MAVYSHVMREVLAVSRGKRYENICCSPTRNDGRGKKQGIYRHFHLLCDHINFYRWQPAEPSVKPATENFLRTSGSRSTYIRKLIDDRFPPPSISHAQSVTRAYAMDITTPMGPSSPHRCRNRIQFIISNIEKAIGSLAASYSITLTYSLCVFKKTTFIYSIFLQQCLLN